MEDAAVASGTQQQQTLFDTALRGHCCEEATPLLPAVVENVAVKREPLPKLSGVYFITPSAESVGRVVEDFQDRPLYKTAHVFFSSPVPPAVLAAIRACPGLTSRLGNLKEVLTPLICTHQDAPFDRASADCSMRVWNFQEGLGSAWASVHGACCAAAHLLTVFRDDAAATNNFIFKQRRVIVCA